MGVIAFNFCLEFLKDCRGGKKFLYLLRFCSWYLQNNLTKDRLTGNGMHMEAFIEN